MDQQSEDWFGYSVALSNDIAVVGAYHSDEKGEDSGAAYLYELSNNEWGISDGRENFKLLPEGDSATGHLFGRDVSISKDLVIIGAMGGDHGGVYAFSKNNSEWSLQSMTPSTIGYSDSMFGYAVSVSSDQASAIATNNVGDKAILSVFSYNAEGVWANSEIKLSGGIEPQYFSMDSDKSRIVVGHFGERVYVIEKVRITND